MKRMFGTDGIRGVAGEKLTAELSFKVGAACAQLMGSKEHKARILIGKDTRFSGEMFEAALTAGIMSVGANAEIVGVIPTPGMAYLIRKYGADAGIVISASHNSFEHNGIKIFNKDGHKLSDAVEDEIEAIVKDFASVKPAIGENIGKKIVLEQAKKDYTDFVCTKGLDSFAGLKVVLDCANGASSGIAKDAFSRLGAEVLSYFDAPDGVNINGNCGSTAPGNLSKLVVENGADIGFAFDGDADRLIAVDENGEVVDGDKVMAICAIDMHDRGVLKNDTVVATNMSNMGLKVCLKEHGMKLVQTKVGDRYVLEEMLKSGYVLGGEQSGHVIFLRENTTGDGMITAMKLLSIVKRSGKKLSELASVMSVYPQIQINVNVPEEKKNDWSKFDDVQQAMMEADIVLGGNGRVVVRASGTEALVRVMVEGKNAAVIEREAKQIAAAIDKCLNLEN